MSPSPVTVIRKPSTSGDKPALAAKARNTVHKALWPLLAALTGYLREIMADAILDVALSLHAQVHHPHETASRANAWAGRNCPGVDRATRENAELVAVFGEGEAA